MLTALMPLKNFHPEFLRRSLASLRSQSRPDWRLVIVVEPGDECGFRALLAADLADPRFEIVANEGRKLAGAFNTGMRRAETEFVAILLADDMWALEAVEVLARHIGERPEVDFFHSSRQIVDESDRPLSSVHFSREGVTLDDFTRSTPVKHLLCWRRELALSFGGMDESLESVGPDDFDFPWTMAEWGAVFGAVPECLYVYRDHREGERLTTHIPLSVHKAEIRRILEKHGLGPNAVEAWVAHAEVTYLRQCLFRTPADRLRMERARYDPRTGWRDGYR
jgi:glycosyltransferase involved in cell wall biosynthesis